jgi:primosomal protein N' (replication factor Y)
MFCDVVIPHTRLDALTYAVPDNLAGTIKVGSAVTVELRKQRVTGIVAAVTLAASIAHPKPVLEVVEPEFCRAGLLRLTNWVSRYYVASWGETLTLAFPAKVMGYRPRKPWLPPLVSVATGTPPTLTLDQHRAVRAILPPLGQHTFKPFLLFGVTGSGKTEIYLRAAEEALRLGRSALILVPEIALTPLLIARFAERFPGNLAALHSGVRAAERKKYWQVLRDGKVRLAIGARSAVFAPVPDLGLIVVDEEHDHSYKEHERCPHYNARDVAVMRAKFENAVAILASATPSIESFYNAQRGVYELLQLPKRIGDRPVPKAAVINMRGTARRAIVFAPALVSAIKSRMGTDEQVILFVNRRGFSSRIACLDCGHVPQCKFCGMPLVYHADRRTVECHFCRTQVPGFDVCPVCRGTNLDYQGVGTQKAVRELRRLVPGARVLRLDSDVKTKPEILQQILDAFGRGEAKFLVGTQMVTKGFDFPRVTLCAVVSADSTLTMPDFRSAERTFQVLTQVAGRAGRGEKPGQALFQTLHPDHYAVNCAAQQNYEKFYEHEIELRRSLAYPPFSRLALLRIMSPIREACERVGEILKERLAAQDAVHVMGPIPAFRKKKRNVNIYLLLLKARPGIGFSKIIDRRLLDFPKIRVDVDIDPLEIA